MLAVRALEVAEYLKTEVDLTPHDPDKHLYLAAAYHQLGDWDAAARAAGDALVLYVGDTDVTRSHKAAAAHLIRGYAYASLAPQRQDPKEDSRDLFRALEDFQEALRLNPDYAPSHYYMGALRYALRHLTEAETSYETAVALKPDYHEAYNDLGVLYLKSGRDESALKAFEQAVSLNEENPLYLRNLAQTYMKLERWRDAELLLQKSLALGAPRADTYNDLGFSYLKQQLFRQAEEAYRHSIQLRPGVSAPHYNLGWVHYLTGRPDEAEQAFMRTQELAPADPEPRRALRLLRLKRLKDEIEAMAETMGRINVDELAAYVTKEVAYAVRGNAPGPQEPLTRDELRAMLGPAAERLGEEDRLQFAARLYERGLMPADEAAWLAGLDGGKFMEWVTRFGIPVLGPDAGETLPPGDPTAAVALLRSWLDEDPEEQRETWDYLRKALDKDRLSDRKLFP
jgi:tetratricopeptide (TPR) repeat protein